MFFVGIIGDRKRGGDPTADTEKIRDIINQNTNNPAGTVFVSIGCDMGIGKTVKDVCAERDLPFLELSCMFHQFGEAAGRGHAHIDAYLARNCSIYHLCQVFYLFVRDSRHGIIEHLAKMLKDFPKEHSATMVYDETNTVVESYPVDWTGGKDGSKENETSN